jgi:hypothetical protein
MFSVRPIFVLRRWFKFAVCVYLMVTILHCCLLVWMKCTVSVLGIKHDLKMGELVVYVCGCYLNPARFNINF